MAGWDDAMFANLPRPRIRGRVAATPEPGQVLTPAVQAARPQASLNPGPPSSYGDQLAQQLYSWLKQHGPNMPDAGAQNIARAAGAAYGLTPPGSFESGIRSGMQGDAAGYVTGILGAAPIPGAPGARTAEEAAAGGARRALTDIAPDIRNLPVAEGIAQARTEAHLIPAKGGGYVGFPPDIQSYADLQARRGQVDDYIAQHLGGADWYDRARGGFSAASGGDPAASEWLSKLHGSLSAGVSPESETAFAIKEAVSRAAGDPQVAHWGAQSSAIDRAIAANDPSLMQFGDKTEEYASKINPNQPPFQNATGVNDFRQLKLWGYPGRAEGVDPSAKETRHRVLDYETALTADRANQAQLGGRSDWTGEQIQAVPWVTQKAEDLGIPFEEAAKAGPDFYPKHAAAATYEQQPGQALVDRGHLPNASGMSADERAAYAANDPWTDPTGRDVIYGGGRVANASGEKTGLGVPTLPTLSATGVWKDETNPARIAQPVMPFDVSSKANPIPGAPLGTKSLPPYARDFLNAGEMIRSTFGAQEGGGAHKLWAKQAPGAQNAVFVPLDRDATRPEIDALSAAGKPFGLPDVTSTSGGLAVLNYEGAPKLSSKDRNGLLNAIGAAKPDDAGDHVLRRADTVYAGPNWTTPGAYTATQSMLDAAGDNPFFTQNAGIGQAAGALARRDEAPQLGGQGKDFWNLRMLAAVDPGPSGQTWADRLKTAVQSRAVPATAMVGGASVGLYPEAGLPATPQQPPPGASLNSPPGWLQQYWNGGL